MSRIIIRFRKRPNAVRVPVGIAAFVVLAMVGDVAKSNIPMLGYTVPYAVSKKSGIYRSAGPSLQSSWASLRPSAAA